MLQKSTFVRSAMSALLVIFMTVSVFAQSNVTGVVTDGSNKEPLVGATVSIKGTTNGTTTDVDGKFSLQNVPTGKQTLVISFIGFIKESIVFSGDETSVINVTLMEDANALEEIVVTGVMDIVQDRRTPVAVSTISVAEIQAKSVGNVEFPEVLKNTPSVYVSNQTGFGDSQMFTRGFNQINTAFLLNGQPINGMEDGRMYWSNWSGMADVANAVQIQRGLGSSKLAISSVGGTINIVTKTIEQNQGGYARVMTGNDGYLKGTVSYNSGKTGKDNKWAYSFLLDHWQADNKWAQGTAGQGQNYFLSVGYTPAKNHTLNFLVTGAPQWHGQRWSQSRETLEADPKFNQHWGEYQDEKFYTERRNFYHKPIINLSWDWDVSEKTKFSSVVYASFGRGGGTGELGRGRIRTEAGQVDFNAIQAAGEADADGIGTFGDNYALRASMNNHQWYGNISKFETDITENLNWSIGYDLRWYQGDHFRQLVNTFGLDSWNESFRHATRPNDYQVTETFSADPWSALFNFADESQRVAYDYSEDINYQGTFSQLEYKKDDFSIFVQGALSSQSYQRDGRWEDQGKSEKIAKIGYNLKGGASYTINDQHTFFVNTGFYSRQPFLDNIFNNIRYSNEFIAEPEDIQNEEITGFELGYKYTRRNFEANVNLYNTVWANRSTISVFQNDGGTPDNDGDDFAERVIERGIGQTHRGFEVDGKYRYNNLTLRGYLSAGDWTYNNVDRVLRFNDDTGILLEEVEGANIEGVHTTEAPQFSTGFGAKYEIVEGLTVDADYNFYDNLWITAGTAYQTEDIGTLDSFGLLDAGLAYRFKVGNNYLSARTNVYNLLNTVYINQADRFGFFNGNGRTWNLSLRYDF